MILGTDVSFYEVSQEAKIDFEKMKSANVKFVIIRAGQNLWIDSELRRNISECKRLKIPYGSYWFYDSRIEPKKQAELWINALAGDFGKLPLFFDIEEYYNGSYKGSNNWIIFMEHLKTLVGNHEIGIYSNFYFFKDNCKESDKAYFKQYPLWIATYANSPMVPSPFEDYLFWQFSETGASSTYGTPGGKVDLNYFNGTEEDFNIRFKIENEGNEIPVDNTAKLLLEKQYYDGAIYRQYEINMPYQGLTTYHVIEFDTKKMELFVSPNPRGNNYVPVLTKKYGMDFGINADGFKGNDITGYAISNGQPYGTQGKEQTLYVSKENNFSFTRPSVLNMAFSFPNVLVKDGVIPKIDKADDYRARTAIGYTKDQKKFFVLVIDGKDYFEEVGMTFKETAKVLLDLGCDFACMMDGGGSTTLSVVENGIPKLLNKAWGEEKIAGYPYPMRPVAQMIGFKMKTPPIISEPPEEIPEEQTGGTMTTYIVKKSARFRSLPTTKTDDKGESSIVNNTFESSITQLDTNNSSITMVKHPNGKWLPLKIGIDIYTEAKTVSVPVEEPLPTTDYVVHYDSNGKEIERFYRINK